MSYSFYVTDRFGNRIPVHIRSATKADLVRTIDENWQTDWTSDYIQQNEGKIISMEIRASKEVIGLCLCEPFPAGYAEHMVYMESSPSSNPTLVKPSARKYYDIGKVFMAYGVLVSLEDHFDGTLFFKAKTTQLYQHYIRDFGAIPLSHNSYDLLLLPENGLELLKAYEEVLR